MRDGARRFVLVGVLLTPCKMRLLFTQEVLRPSSPLRCATRLTSHRGSPSSLRSSSHPRFAVPLTGAPAPSTSKSKCAVGGLRQECLEGGLIDCEAARGCGARHEVGSCGRRRACFAWGSRRTIAPEAWVALARLGEKPHASSDLGATYTLTRTSAEPIPPCAPNSAAMKPASRATAPRSAAL